MTRILLVEDEPGLILTIGDRLRKEGYGVDSATDGEAGEAQAAAGGVDLILLDIMLPKKSGFDVCVSLRERGILTPILMLTARGQTVDKVTGLKMGADDYLTKPFEMVELLARIEALLRRNQAPNPPAPARFACGNITLDTRSTEVTRNGQPVPVSAREFQLLHYFVQHPGAMLSREELLNQVWGYRSVQSTRTVDVHVAWLRQKLEDDVKHPLLITTVHGLGYKWTAEVTPKELPKDLVKELPKDFTTI